MLMLKAGDKEFTTPGEKIVVVKNVTENFKQF